MEKGFLEEETACAGAWDSGPGAGDEVKQGSSWGPWDLAS